MAAGLPAAALPAPAALLAPAALPAPAPLAAAPAVPHIRRNTSATLPTHPQPAGTVIPAQDSLYAAVSVGEFKKRSAAPTGGQGAFVVGPLQGQLLGAAASVQLVNAAGVVLART